jgi:hypothetical protein
MPQPKLGTLGKRPVSQSQRDFLNKQATEYETKTAKLAAERFSRMFEMEGLSGLAGFLIACASVILAVAFVVEHFKVRRGRLVKNQVDELEHLFTL